jgi:hypothetical protein
MYGLRRDHDLNSFKNGSVDRRKRFGEISFTRTTRRSSDRTRTRLSLVDTAMNRGAHCAIVFTKIPATASPTVSRDSLASLALGL